MKKVKVVQFNISDKDDLIWILDDKGRLIWILDDKGRLWHRMEIPNDPGDEDPEDELA